MQVGYDRGPNVAWLRKEQEVSTAGGNSAPTLEDSDASAVLTRYRARFRRQDLLFQIANKALGIFIRSRKASDPAEPKRILVANAGRLGDLIISTAIFPVLKSRFPTAAIDFLTGSYSREAIENHPCIGQVFLLDHWRGTRSGQPLLVRIARYYWQLLSFSRALRQRRYDIALDLHAWHPNYILVFWLAGIPIRAGFGRVGYEPTLTHPVPFRYDRRHEMEHQLDVARALGIAEEHLALAEPNMGPLSAATVERAKILLGLPPGSVRYRVLHPVASTATRDWTLEGWSGLASQLVKDGIIPVVTGAGPRAAAIASDIRAREPAAISLVDKVSWAELMALLDGAELVYSVETSVGHAARALRRPVVAIYGGMDDPLQWAPLGSAVASHPVPCSPCFQKAGCPTRDCLSKLDPADVAILAKNLPQMREEPPPAERRSVEGK